MKRHILIAAIVLAALAPLAAQGVPQGWKMRVDRSPEAADPATSTAAQFVTQGQGFHFTNRQAAVFWNPANTASGVFTVKATFTAVNQPGGEYVGLFFGGSGLEGAEQTYVYFIVSPDGTWQIKNRAGATAGSVVQTTANAAVKSTNAMEVRVGAAKIDFVVNGVVVHSAPKSGALAKTDGIYGIRVNHRIEVQVDGFGLSK